ncbi:MAG: DUF6290 family protein [Synergistales bacterium]|jgi:RHH-type rel operon transcriptional repressor/antitoxin RelB|nr:DUF6290 family protein [Synergistales bacterium]
MSTPLSIRLDDETGKRLDRLSRETGRTKAFYIRKMIEDSIDDMEDYYLAAEVMEKIRSKEISTRPWDEAMNELED